MLTTALCPPRQPEDETQVLPVEDNDVVPLDDVSLFDDSVNELGRELEVLLSGEHGGL